MRKLKLRDLPLLLFFGGAVALILYYILGPAGGEFHSDCTDTLFWAQASYDAGRLFKEDFTYACLLPFGGQLLMLPFIPLFGVSYETHMAGMVVFTLLFSAALLFAFRKGGFSFPGAGAATGVVLLVLTSSAKLREIFFGHIIYYSLGILFLLVGLGLLHTLLNGGLSRVKWWIFAGLLWLWTLLCATNGLQALVIYILPLTGALFLETFFRLKKPLLDEENWPAGGLALGLVCATMAGWLLRSVLCGDLVGGYADAYSTFSDMNSWMDNAQLFVPHWFSLLGVTIRDGDPLVSATSIANLVRLLVGAVLLIVPVVMLCLYRRLPDRGVRILVLSHALLSAGILFGFICGRLSAANWRLSPMVCTAAMVTLAGARMLLVGVETRRLAAALIAVLSLSSLLSAREVLSLKTGRDDHPLYQAAIQLEKRGLQNGYATFWNAQAMTVLSSEAVQVRSVVLESNGVCRPYYYQSQRRWFETQPGQTTWFLLLSPGEWTLLQRTDSPLLSQAADTVSVGTYTALVFDHNLF